MSLVLHAADAVVNAASLVVLVGAGGFCALILPSAWRGR